MSYSETLDRHRRLAVLTHLSGCSGYSSNSEILLDVLSGLGITTSRDTLIATVAWLAEQGLVTIADNDAPAVVEATARGVDVAEGRARHPGVRRPAPQAR